ncbi:hypothetical protein [Aeromonas allosaccharophila]
MRLFDRRPGTEQNAIGAYLHGAAIVIDMELFEGKSATTPHLAPVI